MAYQTSLYISYTKEKEIRSIYEKGFKNYFYQPLLSYRQSHVQQQMIKKLRLKKQKKK